MSTVGGSSFGGLGFGMALAFGFGIALHSTSSHTPSSFGIQTVFGPDLAAVGTGAFFAGGCFTGSGRGRFARASGGTSAIVEVFRVS